MICIKCGFVNDDNSNYCLSCGALIGDAYVDNTPVYGGVKIVGYDPYTGKPIYEEAIEESEAEMLQNDRVITGYDPYTGEPIYGEESKEPEADISQGGRAITGYDPYTGEPIYEEESKEPEADISQGGRAITGYDPYTGEPIYGEESKEPEADMSQVGRAITGYDPYTGEPIYDKTEPEITSQPEPLVLESENASLPEPQVTESEIRPQPEPLVSESENTPQPEPQVTESEIRPQPEPLVSESENTPQPEPQVTESEITPQPKLPVSEPKIIPSVTEVIVEEDLDDDDTPMTEVWIEDPEKGQERKPTAEQRMGTVVAISGVVNGQGFRLPATNVIVVGSNSKKATWIIKDKLVSGEHCQIRYNAIENIYIVTDLSRNGTFVGDERLEREKMTKLKAGTVISLADGTNQIRLG